MNLFDAGSSKNRSKGKAGIKNDILKADSILNDQLEMGSMSHDDGNNIEENAEKIISEKDDVKLSIPPSKASAIENE